MCQHKVLVGCSKPRLPAQDAHAHSLTPGSEKHCCTRAASFCRGSGGPLGMLRLLLFIRELFQVCWLPPPPPPPDLALPLRPRDPPELPSLPPPFSRFDCPAAAAASRCCSRSLCHSSKSPSCALEMSSTALTSLATTYPTMLGVMICRMQIRPATAAARAHAAAAAHAQDSAVSRQLASGM